MKNIGEAIALKNQLEQKISTLSKDGFYLQNVENAEAKINDLRGRLDFLRQLLSHWPVYQWLIDDNAMDSQVLDV